MPYSDWRFAQHTDALEKLLLALKMHPMFYRQSFAILRLNLREMSTNGLHPDIIELSEYFSSLPDDQLYAAWERFTIRFGLKIER